jgi:hypothetical protein
MQLSVTEDNVFCNILWRRGIRYQVSGIRCEVVDVFGGNAFFLESEKLIESYYEETRCSGDF